MPDETADYEQLLRDLMAERHDLDRMIAWVQKRLGHSVDPSERPTVNSSVQSSPLRFPRIAADSFFRMTVPQAIKEFLNISKRPKSAKEITAALQDGGLTHQAKNLYATVYPTLLRMEKTDEVVRVGKREWGLSEWYPGGRKSADKGPDEKSESEG
jgi:hypothetical protein